MGLPSRWSDEPKLVEKAKEQDNYKSITVKKGEPLVSKWGPVTSEKGKPLASKWATAGTDGDSEVKHTTNKHDGFSKKSNSAESTKEKSSFDKKLDLASRIQALKLEQAQKQAEEVAPTNKTVTKPVSHPIAKPIVTHTKESEEDEWEDEDEEEEEGSEDDVVEEDDDDEVEAELEEEVEEEPTAPTAAAQDLASRLGLSLNIPKGPKNPQGTKKNHNNSTNINTTDRPRNTPISKNPTPKNPTSKPPHSQRTNTRKDSTNTNKDHVRLKRDQERLSHKNKKLESNISWDEGKPGTKSDYSWKKPNTEQTKPTIKKDEPPKKPINLEDFALQPGTNWADLDDEFDF